MLAGERWYGQLRNLQKHMASLRLSSRGDDTIGNQIFETWDCLRNVCDALIKAETCMIGPISGLKEL